MGWLAPLYAMDKVDILHAADQSRGNLEGVNWEVFLESTKGERISSMTLDVKARGFDIRAENLAPAKYKGNKILLLKGNMWFYKPGISKPVPISRRQKLLGLAAYGDIASTNYVEEYEGDIVNEEEIEGDLCYVFELKPKSKKTTYDKIQYWISRKRLVGLRAEYFTVSGKKFKSAVMQYDHTVKIEGESRPFISRITFYDELMSSDSTFLAFKEPAFKKLPDYIFNLNLLK
jgi:outer membrane lipoprotein-sorting protein